MHIFKMYPNPHRRPPADRYKSQCVGHKATLHAPLLDSPSTRQISAAGASPLTARGEGATSLGREPRGIQGRGGSGIGSVLI